MSTLGPDETAVQPGTSRRGRLVAWLRGERRRVLAATTVIAAVAALVAGGAVAWHQWTHPGLLADTDASWGIRLGPRPVDKATVSVPLTWTDTGTPHTLTFKSASATLASNTAAAHVTFAICVRRPGHIATLGIYRLRSECSSVTPITPGATMTYPSDRPLPHQYIVATIAPTRPGQVHLTKATFSYSLPSHHLPRPITESMALDVTVPVR